MVVSDEQRERYDRRGNQICAILLPLLEAGGAGFATFVLIYQLCIQYLIHPTLPIDARPSTGIALIVVYCVLLLTFAITFLRLLQLIWMNRDVTALGDPKSEKQTAGTQYFDRKDAYVCDYQGQPIWCEKCHNWKPDRTHHSSQLGRCVRRFDHYCPYAGGMIGESTYKFFLQFVFYGSLYTGYVLVVMAVFLAERHNKGYSRPTTWTVLIAVSAFFFMFTFGMFANTFYQLAINRTTVEMRDAGNVTHIALLGKLPPPSTASSERSAVLFEIQRSHSRSFIVCQTLPGENPWDMGVWKNLCSIMGDSVIDWFLPFRMSPCTKHTDPAGEFGWGKVVQRMMDEYGVGTAYERARRSRRRRSSRVSATQA